LHQFGTIKKCFDTVDARYKHEDSIVSNTHTLSTQLI